MKHSLAALLDLSVNPKQIEDINDSNQWYTPAHIVEAGRSALGGSIDLDPASCREANEAYIRATKYYTKQDDGLTQPWFGRIWLNPPYGVGFMPQFVDKAIETLRSPDFKAMVVLTNNYGDTRWWRKLYDAAQAVCIVQGRLKFWRPGNAMKPQTNKWGQSLFYFGERPDLFFDSFGQYGLILKYAPPQ
jgi:phage N-6-adenine-methyltransferase